MSTLKQAYTALNDHHNEARQMIVCAIVIGLADIIVTAGDIVWLIGDFLHSPQKHHYLVGSILIPGLILMIASFVWLYKAILRRTKRHLKWIAKKKAQQQVQWERLHKLNYPTHCGVNLKRDIIKQDYSKYEGLD